MLKVLLEPKMAISAPITVKVDTCAFCVCFWHTSFEMASNQTLYIHIYTYI